MSCPTWSQSIDEESAKFCYHITRNNNIVQNGLATHNKSEVLALQQYAELDSNSKIRVTYAPLLLWIKFILFYFGL